MIVNTFELGKNPLKKQEGKTPYRFISKGKKKLKIYHTQQSCSRISSASKSRSKLKQKQSSCIHENKFVSFSTVLTKFTNNVKKMLKSQKKQKVSKQRNSVANAINSRNSSQVQFNSAGNKKMSMPIRKIKSFNQLQDEKARKIQINLSSTINFISLSRENGDGNYKTLEKIGGYNIKQHDQNNARIQIRNINNTMPLNYHYNDGQTILRTQAQSLQLLQQNKKEKLNDGQNGSKAIIKFRSNTLNRAQEINCNNQRINPEKLEREYIKAKILKRRLMYHIADNSKGKEEYLDIRRYQTITNNSIEPENCSGIIYKKQKQLKVEDEELTTIFQYLHKKKLMNSENFEQGRNHIKQQVSFNRNSRQGKIRLQQNQNNQKQFLNKKNSRMGTRQQKIFVNKNSKQKLIEDEWKVQPWNKIQ